MTLWLHARAEERYNFCIANYNARVKFLMRILFRILKKLLSLSLDGDFTETRTWSDSESHFAEYIELRVILWIHVNVTYSEAEPACSVFLCSLWQKISRRQPLNWGKKLCSDEVGHLNVKWEVMGSKRLHWKGKICEESVEESVSCCISSSIGKVKDKRLKLVPMEWTFHVLHKQHTFIFHLWWRSWNGETLRHGLNCPIFLGWWPLFEDVLTHLDSFPTFSWFIDWDTSCLYYILT